MLNCTDVVIYRKFWLACLLLASAFFYDGQAAAGELTCTQALPCTVADLSISGNYFVARYSDETASFSNFNNDIGDFGGAYTSVWGEFDKHGNPRLVMEPSSMGDNPWRISSNAPNYPSTGYLSILQYSLEYTGFYHRISGSITRQSLSGADLNVTFGEFANSGGLSLTGMVSEGVAVTNSYSADLSISCQDLEVNVFIGCKNQQGTERVSFQKYSPSVTVNDVIDLSYVTAGFDCCGGILEVTKLQNTFSVGRLTGIPEPETLWLLFLGLLGIILTKRS